MHALYLLVFAASLHAQTYDIVIRNGRVIDPESKLDAVRSIGIKAGKVTAISSSPLNGSQVIDAQGMIVAPGFIDLHSHGQDAENYRAKAMDGVTSALECEIGVGDVGTWYSQREGKALIHYGATAGHVPVRIRLFHDTGAFLPADKGAHQKSTAEEVTQMARSIEKGLQQGAVGVGFGLMYTPGANALEYLELFRVASRFHAPAFTHVNSGVEGLNEVIGYAASTGASLHVVHLNSSGGRRNTRNFLRIVEDSRAHGMDVTTECYPYTAGQTRIESAVYDGDWQARMGISYSDLLWTATGERLTAETYAKYRKSGGSVIAFSNSEASVDAAVTSPLTMIASDGILRSGQGHPRSTGTYARILGRYVRERQLLTMMDAITKMSIMPARRLENRVPEMKNKGRIKVGSDADIVVFDAQRVIDRSDYVKPAVYSEGFRFVLVNGVPVVRDGHLVESQLPGRPIRAAVR